MKTHAVTVHKTFTFVSKERVINGLKVFVTLRGRIKEAARTLTKQDPALPCRVI